MAGEKFCNYEQKHRLRNNKMNKGSEQRKYNIIYLLTAADGGYHSSTLTKWQQKKKNVTNYMTTGSRKGEWLEKNYNKTGQCKLHGYRLLTPLLKVGR